MRSGVMARLASRSLNVQSPSQWVTKVIGLALRSPVAARESNKTSGARHSVQAATFSATRERHDIRLAHMIHEQITREAGGSRRRTGRGAPPRNRGFCAWPEAVASLSWRLAREATASGNAQKPWFRGGA